MKALLSGKFLKNREVAPHQETGDTDVANHDWPSRLEEKMFDFYKAPKAKGPMQQAREWRENAKKEIERGSATTAEQKLVGF